MPGCPEHGGSVYSMDHRNSMDNRAGHSVDHGSGVDHGSSMVDGTGNSNSLGVDSGSTVGDLSDISLNVVGSVGYVLGAAVREGDGVRSSPSSSAIISLGSLEVGARVVVGNGVLVLVGGDLVGVHLSDGVGNGVGNSVVDNRGGVDDGGSMGNNGGSVDNRAGDGVGNRGGVDDRAGNSVGNRVGNPVSNNTVGKSMTNNTVGKSVTNNTVGNTSNNSSLSKVASEARLGSVAHRVRGSDGGDGGTEALGLAGSPDLTLEGLGH